MTTNTNTNTSTHHHHHHHHIHYNLNLSSNLISFVNSQTKKLFPMLLLFLIFCLSLIFLLSKFLTFTHFFQESKLFSPTQLKKTVTFHDENKYSLLDLPDLPLDCILNYLSPKGLSTMMTVCVSMRQKCKSDYFWEKHMNQKWGRVITEAAYREWQWFIIASKKKKAINGFNQSKGYFSNLSNLIMRRWATRDCCEPRRRSVLDVDSVMALFIALEMGEFWFPAQVYNRENGNAGFMLSCYDAQVSYDSRTDTFQARYSPHRRRMMEENITWDRIRAPPIDNPAHVLHISDCLHDLKPGDHIEIQWRRNNDFSYGWWYGVVGHLESCDQNKNHCNCRYNDTVILEFNQYTPDSRWRRTTVNRKDHREEGNDVDGFYGGIRKVYKENEISIWKNLWPKKILE